MYVNPEWLRYPLGIILAVNYIYILILLVAKEDKWKWVNLLTGSYASALSLVAMLVTTDNIYQMVNVLKTVEEKHRALSELYFLPMDQKTTVYRFFMNNDVFAKNMIRCLGFMSSAKIDMKISFMIDPEVFHNEHIIPSDYIIDIAQTAATRLPGLLVSVKVETNGTWAEHIFGTECKEGSREENK